jgi:hypothetical protein
MNHALASILSQKAADFDAVQDARELQAALASLTTKTPSIVADVVSPIEIIRKTDNPGSSPASDQSIAEFRKLTRSGESQ